ncbi:sporulation protein YpjB [Oceanobacillus senegalensis]|uniref:sporulation protein YpjB n=1 Tax=Oceanobacillus senegalensis TaxID=1936063 RepID=UPI000A313DDC|nr:sporulation protein YpjB [Oceanobacillus senegalensis]
MENTKKLQVLLIFIIVIGMLLFFQFETYTVKASPVETPVETNFDWSPLIWATIIIAGSIGITLSYVSWRKYKGEQKEHNKRKDKMID